MSTPNAEPVVVMDDELLRDLSDLIYPHGRGSSEDARIRAGAQLTREEGVVRRLMAAWLNEGIRRAESTAQERAEATRAPDCFEMDHVARLADHEQRWTRIHDWARDLGCRPGAVTLDWLQQFVTERQANGAYLAEQLDRAQEEWARRGDALRRAEREWDEARATKDLHKERQQELEAALTTAEEDRDEARHQRNEARATIDRVVIERQEAEARTSEWARRAGQAEREAERLRAADLVLREQVRKQGEALASVPSLPDVGPVTRNGEGFVGVDGRSYSDHRGAGDFRLRAARLLAVAAFLDSEAVDHTHDDEVGPLPTGTPLLTPDGRILYAGSSLERRSTQEAVTFEPRLEHVGWFLFADMHAWADAHRARNGQGAGQ